MKFAAALSLVSFSAGIIAMPAPEPDLVQPNEPIRIDARDLQFDEETNETSIIVPRYWTRIAWGTQEVGDIDKKNWFTVWPEGEDCCSTQYHAFHANSNPCDTNFKFEGMVDAVLHGCRDIREGVNEDNEILKYAPADATLVAKKVNCHLTQPVTDDGTPEKYKCKKQAPIYKWGMCE